MLITHFKQAWQLLRQNKLFSGIYIFGTALAITSTTLFGIVYYVKIAPVYPEYNRSRQAEITSAEEREGKSMSQSGISLLGIKDYIYKLKNATDISAYVELWLPHAVNFDDGRPDLNIKLKPADPAFFKVFSYEFIDGSPFSQIDFESGIKKAAISDFTAEKIFGTTDGVVGKTVSIDFTNYTVCGVFREGSAINATSFAHIIVPYTSVDGFADPHPTKPFMGSYKAVMLTDNLDALKAETRAMESRYNADHEGHKLSLWDQPESILTMAFKEWPGDTNFDWAEALRHNSLILLVLLLVPALNLSGMISGRMDSRSSELGLRKSFGATDRHLLSQVLWENLLLTIIGGAIGLIFSWFIMSTEAGWLFASIGGSDIDNSYVVRLTPDMMFAPAIFAFAFAVCIILNILSALAPAWLSLRRPIVNSLKDK